MSMEGVVICDDALSCGPATGSPKNKVKFLCSHGGKILPRPADGRLKYVGGETRIISVPRDIKFPDLMKKLSDLIEGDMVLKYQLIPEDLDALVSVKSDDDLHHMFDEYDRYETTGSPRFRAFLFPAHPIVVENHTDTQSLEQRYIDAINGVLRVSFKSHPALNTTHLSSLSISSACTSPRSPDSTYTDAMNQEIMLLNNYNNHSGHLHKVHSSPCICNLNIPYQCTSPGAHQHHHHLNLCYDTRQPPFHSHVSNKPPIDPHRVSAGPERLMSVRSFGRAEGIRYQIDNAPTYYYSYSKHHARANGFCPNSKCMPFDECGSCHDRRTDRTRSLSPSPLSMSPRHSHALDG